MNTARKILFGCGCVMACIAAYLIAAGMSARWGEPAPFDVLGLLPVFTNLGYVFAYFWGGVFAIGALWCWVKAALMRS